MTLGDRERRRGERGHLAFPPLLSVSHSHRRAQLGKALGSERPMTPCDREGNRAQKGGGAAAGWVLAGSGETAGVHLLDSPLCSLPCPCGKERDPGSPRSTEPAARDRTVTGGGWVALIIAPTQGV